MTALPTKITAALALAVLLGACSGSSNGGDANENRPGPGVRPPLTEPLSTKTADLIAFAQAGHSSEFENGVMRAQNTVADGGFVRHDTVAGSKVSRVAYTGGAAAQDIYRVQGRDAVVTAPSGVYTGEIDMTWQDGATAAWNRASGRMAIVLDLHEGHAFVDSIVGNANNNIEYMGDAQVNGDTLKSGNMIVHVRDGEGYFKHRVTGTLDGRIASGNGAAAILGTAGAHDAAKGFTMKGGFSTGFDQGFTDELNAN
ncbi:hypothetical protein GCM10011402_29410 [Paracoccus acridae]|uniref:Transferrin-binding protein B C-lobe/N-lobe beta barrel domain-containing protein n=1 Tax=Paracoccus acridae TaxID=1795310 RepID=A0ABQ1VKJ6_9RHOB|nr:hypothetical protein [Paracoccus acridae]GGF74838.1 hypothetical protein GCM10011402_29410 [Paracoccus acridae]